MDQPTLHRLLANSSFFRGLEPDALGRVTQSAHTHVFARDEFFFHQNDPATTLYILVAGDARLLQLTPEGNQVLLRFVSVGEMFGGVAFLGARTYPASAQAVSESTAATWDGEAMKSLMDRYPRISFNALEHMATVIEQLQDRVRELGTERVGRRIANALLRLAHQTGQKTSEGVLISLPLSRQDLAEMSGTTLYTVSRIMSRWEEEGIVEGGRERVLIRSPHRLVMIADDLPPPSRSS